MDSALLERLAEWEYTTVEVWSTDFEVEERPSPDHTLICMYCLTQCGRIRYIHWRSKSFMCHEHVYLYRSWRKASGMSPIQPFVNSHAGVGRSRHGEQVRQCIMQMLTEVEIPTMEVARALGRTREGALYQLRKLQDGGMVKGRWDRGFYWRLA